MENGSKMAPKFLGVTPPRLTVSRPFPKVDFLMHFGCHLAHFGILLAPFWLPFGSVWLPFASFWLSFGSLWLPFGSLWLTFGSLLVSFGSLLLSLGRFFIFFMHFWWTCHAICFFPLKIFRHPISQHTCRLIEGATLRKAIFLCTVSSPTRPGAEPCRRQLRSAPGPEAPEACLSLAWVPYLGFHLFSIPPLHFSFSRSSLLKFKWI